MKIIDSHQHFWTYDPRRHAWIEDHMSVLRRDFLPADLQAVFEKFDVEGCIAVQADQSDKENEFLLECATAHKFVKAVVGWVPLNAKSALTKALDKWSQNPWFKGVRHIVQSEEAGFMLQPSFLSGIEKLCTYDLTYDILIYPHQLEEAAALVQRFPEMSFVIDHIAKPNIAGGAIAEWSDHIQAIAAHQNVYCKLSGMVTENHWSANTTQEYQPYIDVVFRAFGIDRIMFGSDWPVCLLAASYANVLEIVDRYLIPYTNEEREKVFYSNAHKFYKLSEIKDI